MIWQDIIMMVAAFILTPALIVSIVKKTSYPLGTSIPTALALTLMAICTFTLGLHLTALAIGLTTICWFILVFRRRVKQ